MMHSAVANSIEAFGRDEWNRLFPDELEDWSYYRAVERSGLAEFHFVYFGVREDSGRLQAAVPAFVTDYRLDTTLKGGLRRFSDALSKRFPRLLRQPLLSLGSPVSEICHLGFAPECDAASQDAALDLLLHAMETYAQAQRMRMVASKDAAAAQDHLWAHNAQAHGLRRQPGLPTALLDIKFDSLDEYLGSLSAATRKDMRRKLKGAAAVRVEWRDDIDDIRDEVMRLYRSTHANADFQFEELNAEYFSGVLRELGPRARCATYWLDGRLIAFNLVLFDGWRLLDKFLGMDYRYAKKYNLYFLTWMENVRFAIAHKLMVYQSGQGLHREKVRLGSRLSANWLWYRHRNRIVDRIFASAERLFRLDRHDAELSKLLTDLPAAKPRLPVVRPTTLLAWCILLTFAALSQISLKYAGLDTGAFDFSARAFGLATRSIWLWVSVFSHLGEFVVWMTILRKSNLSSAFPTSAILMVGVMLAGWVLFAEPFGWQKIIGSTLILIGIVLLGPDSDEEPAPARIQDTPA